MGKEQVRWVACPRCGAYWAADAERCLRCGIKYPQPPKPTGSRLRIHLGTVMLGVVPIALACAALRAENFQGALITILIAAAAFRAWLVLRRPRETAATDAMGYAIGVFVGSMVVVFVGCALLALFVLAGGGLVVLIWDCWQGRQPAESLTLVLPVSIVWLALTAWCLRRLWKLRHARWLALPIVRVTRRTRPLVEVGPSADAPADPESSPARQEELGAFYEHLGAGLTKRRPSPWMQMQNRLVTALVGMVPIVLVFAMARIPQALAVAVFLLFALAARPWSLLERERTQSSNAASASRLARFLARLGRLPALMLARASTSPAGLAAGALVLLLTTFLLRAAGAGRMLVVSAALIASALWAILVLALVRETQVISGSSRRRASHAGALPAGPPCES